MLLFVVKSLKAKFSFFDKENSKLKEEKTKLKNENASLKRQNLILKSKLVIHNRTMISHEKVLRNDEDAVFYTGFKTVQQFYAFHDIVSKYVKRRWYGAKNATTLKRRFKSAPKKFGPVRKLESKNEFLLVCMRLRLGTLLKQLADGFVISKALASRIISSWIGAMDIVIGRLVFWPSKDAIHTTKPQRYRVLPGIRSIIDCSEIFIETPKDPILQNITWSDYKHHNTGKFLISVAPNSQITFISKVYNGRASDKAITLSSGFLDLLEPYDFLQADKGFNIADECAARLITLQVPPGMRGVSQMSSAAVNKTKRVANLRILVEQVICRLKAFRILRETFKINQIQHID